MRILLWNTAYGSGLDGSFRGYLLRFYRFLHSPAKSIERIRNAIREIVLREVPDICCFLEVRPNMDLKGALGKYSVNTSNKYGCGGFLSRLPIYRKNCNAVCTRKKVHLSSFDLRNGTKKLVYRLGLWNDVTVFVVHLALSARVRQKQLAELGERIANTAKVIVCGDFNIASLEELQPLLERTNLQVPTHPGRSFPAVSPRKSYDLFLCTSDVGSANCTVLSDVHGSDHLPVMLSLA